ncbi:LysE family translocator [Microbulbifer variabilis]|uniref:LysE family translocator n=1 Tax=Microbulbifer variabilis TaxID=266805 RepID=UPI001CFDF1D9|nr:LysE family translocator [Microbulbifer variabilis]
MGMEFVLTWLAVMFPLIFSPGPANITFAAAGANLGIRRSLPLLAGIDLVFIIEGFLVGFGLMAWLIHYPIALRTLQVGGVIYLIYLAYHFAKPKPLQSRSEPPKISIWNGMVIQILNVKGWIIVFTMFSIFAPKLEHESNTTIITLIGMMTILNLSTHLCWIAFGNALTKFASNATSQRLQSVFFPLSLLSVAIWLALDNPIFFIHQQQ